MAKIDELKILADKIAELLNGVEDTEINHNECGTLIRFGKVYFSYEEKG